MKKKQWWIVGGILLLVVIAVLLCVVFLQPKAIDGTVMDCQYPFYCQNSKDGILVVVNGEFAENSWQIECASDDIISVSPVKVKRNYASYLVQPQGKDGYTIMTLTLTDGSEQDGFQISFSFLVDVYGNLTVSRCSYEEPSPVFTGSGEIGEALYSYTLYENTMELNLQGSSKYQWSVIADFPDAYVIGPTRSYPGTEAAEESDSGTENIQDGLTEDQTGELNDDITTELSDEEYEYLFDYDYSEMEGIAVDSVDTFIVSGCRDATMTACSSELNLALMITFAYDEKSNLIVSEITVVPYDAETMDEEILSNKEMMELIGEKAMFAALNPYYFGVEDMYAYQMAEMRLTIGDMDWYCEITPGMSAEDFCSARAYEGADNQEVKTGEQTVILSVIEDTVTVFWAQDELAFRITGQSECTTEEALSAAQCLIDALK